MHSERAPWYLQLATWGGVVFLAGLARQQGVAIFSNP